MKTTNGRQGDEPVAPQVHRRLRRRGGRRARARPAPAVRDRRRRRPREAATLAPDAPEINAWVVVKPDDTLRDPHRPLGDGPGHDDRPRAARRRGARVRLERRSSTEFPTPGESLARKRAWGEMGTGGSRGIRTSQDYVRRGGAAARMMLLQAAADEWKVPGRRAHGRRTASSRMPPRSARRPTARSRRRRRSLPRPTRRRSSSRTRRTGRSPASR